MRRVILPLMLLVAVGCQPTTTELTEEQKAEIAAEVDSVMNEWWAAWSTDLDFDRAMSFVLDHQNMVWINDAQGFYTKSGVDEAFRPLAASIRRQDVTPIDSRTIVVAPDVVYTIRTNALVQVDTAGNASPEHRFAETIVWVKRNGEWKVFIGHGSTPQESM